MGRHNRHGSVRKKIKKRTSRRKSFLPEVYVDSDLDFASIKIGAGVEARSYEKDGFVFCEDKRGNIIEVQVLNLSKLAKQRAA